MWLKVYYKTLDTTNASMPRTSRKGHPRSENGQRAMLQQALDEEYVATSDPYSTSSHEDPKGKAKGKGKNIFSPREVSTRVL